MKRISIFATYLGKINRGAETFVIELTKELKKKYNITIYSSSKVEGLEDHIKIVKYDLPIWFEIYQRIYNTNRYFAFICDRIYYAIPTVIEQYYFNRALHKQYSKFLNESDIIFPNNGIWGVRLANKIRKIKDIPFIYTGHGGIGDGERKIIKLMPDRYIALTEESKKWATTYCKNVNKIYNGINLDEFSPSPHKNDRVKTILCVGAFTHFKRQKLLINAIEKLENVKLILLGKGELEEKLKIYGKKTLGNRFEIKSVSYKEIRKYYNECDAFSLPSLNEPFGIVYLEALASNKPIIAPNDETRKEIIGDAGVYCDVTNPQEYALAIKEAISKDWYNIPRRRAEEFSWSRIAKEYDDLIQCVTDKYK